MVPWSEINMSQNGNTESKDIRPYEWRSKRKAGEKRGQERAFKVMFELMEDLKTTDIPYHAFYKVFKELISYDERNTKYFFKQIALLLLDFVEKTSDGVYRDYKLEPVERFLHIYAKHGKEPDNLKITQ